MGTVKVIAIKDHVYPYPDTQRKVGDRYEAEERFVELLTKVGYIKLDEQAPEPELPKRNQYERRDMRAKK